MLLVKVAMGLSETNLPELAMTRWNQPRQRFAMIGMAWVPAFCARQTAGFELGFERHHVFFSGGLVNNKKHQPHGETNSVPRASLETAAVRARDSPHWVTPEHRCCECGWRYYCEYAYTHSLMASVHFR